ncbi:hypothetical protein ABZ800_28010 [Streptomyces sp. NPDC047813]|uniref:hypothetical protein n=1 Tax=Streptomyces sp. NPDC047813 TaxID=3154608 RepID=UPI0033DE56FD
MKTVDNSSEARRLLVGRAVSALCFERDYVELHFDGPVLRALSNPFGLYGCHGWRFPAQGSLELMRSYIGKTVDDYEPVPDRLLAVDFGEHRFAIPLEHASRGDSAEQVRQVSGQAALRGWNGEAAVAVGDLLTGAGPRGPLTPRRHLRLRFRRLPGHRARVHVPQARNAS